MKKIIFFTLQPYCPNSDDPNCCSLPGLTSDEVQDLLKAIEKEGWEAELHDIRDVRVMDAFPQAVSLFKKYHYDALPIIIAEDRIVSYGIPDKKFIIYSVKKQIQF